MVRSWTIGAAAVLVGVSLLAGCAKNGGAGGSQAAAPILRHYTGDDAGLKEPAVLLIQSAEQLRMLGSAELINQPVDFNNESLVVVALGEKPSGGYWAHIDEVTVHGNEVMVIGTANRPGEGEAATGQMTHAYDAVVIGKVAATTVSSQIESVSGQAMPAPAPVEAPAAAPAKEETAPAAETPAAAPAAPAQPAAEPAATPATEPAATAPATEPAKPEPSK